MQRHRDGEPDVHSAPHHSLDGPITPEQGIAWLLSAIDREKQEKEWLARRFDLLSQRYDARCTEALELHTEVQRLRATIAKTTGEVPVPTSSLRSPCAGGGGPSIAKGLDKERRFSASAEAGRRRTKEERPTACPVTVITEEVAPPLLGEKPAQPSSGSTVGLPMIRCSTEPDLPTLRTLAEPDSALYRRRHRASDFDVPLAPETPEPSSAIGMHVNTDKVPSLQKLDPECPSSPKRAIKAGRNGFRA